MNFTIMNTYEYKATPNHSRRTYTIRKYCDGKLMTKYRTYECSKEVFDCMLDMTSNDWQFWLNHNQDYYKV